MRDDKVYDVVVLGGGPGGYTAAFRAADLGLEVCLVEKHDRLGGVCLNVGCIPSKTLLHAAAVIEEVDEIAEYGIRYAAPEIDVEKLKVKKESVIQQLTSGLDGLCRARNIVRVQGEGRFLDTGTLLVSGSGGEERIAFKNAVIATGSFPTKLPGFPDDPRIWDSSAALELREIPRRFLVIGGGIIGLEMAQIYSALGAEITIVEMLDQIIPPADKDLVQPLFLKLKKKYTVLTRTKLMSLTPGEDSITVELESAGKIVAREFDGVLVAVGRRPSSAGINLDRIGVVVDDRGFVKVNDRLQTSVPNIYGIGDVAGEPMLAHKAVHEGKVAAEVIAGLSAVFAPLTIPSVAYTSPEIAWMGITEKEAKAQKIDYVKGKFPWGASGRALSAGGSAGVTKVLFDSESKRIIGAGICGTNAGELIHEAVLALEMGATAEDISLTVHAHPTLAETFAFAAEIVDGSITDVLPPKKK